MIFRCLVEFLCLAAGFILCVLVFIRLRAVRRFLIRVIGYGWLVFWSCRSAIRLVFLMKKWIKIVMRLFRIF